MLIIISAITITIASVPVSVALIVRVPATVAVGPLVAVIVAACVHVPAVLAVALFLAVHVIGAGIGAGPGAWDPVETVTAAVALTPADVAHQAQRVAADGSGAGAVTGAVSVWDRVDLATCGGECHGCGACCP